MESCVQLPLDEDLLQELVEKAKDFLLMHGLNTFFNWKLTKFEDLLHK
jgi:hypothetical protein